MSRTASASQVLATHPSEVNGIYWRRGRTLTSVVFTKGVAFNIHHVEFPEIVARPPPILVVVTGDTVPLWFVIGITLLKIKVNPRFSPVTPERKGRGRRDYSTGRQFIGEEIVS